MEEFVQAENQTDFLILCGAAGTGKTSVTAALIGYLNYIGKSYKISAPTGRAARILGRKANTTASTIHSLIYSPKSDKDTGRVAFKLKSGYNGTPAIYIIDEASMVQKEVDKSDTLFEVERGLIYALVQFVKQANVNNKIIFIGDRYQLAPIGETQSYALNQVFLEKTFNLKGATYLLTEVKRQEDGSYILQNATDIRKAIDEKRSYHPIAGKATKGIYAASDNYVKDVNSHGIGNTVSIATSHRANKFFNDLVREKIFGKAKKILEPGDLLLVTQNWYRNGVQLYNGDHVQLLDIDWILQEQVAGLHFVAVKIKLLFSEREIEIDDYTLIDCLISIDGKIEIGKENELRAERYRKNKQFSDSNMPGDDRYVGALRLMYGHAITCNKAQGGEWKKVFINTWGIPSLKWQYTAVTRGINEIESF